MSLEARLHHALIRGLLDTGAAPVLPDDDGTRAALARLHDTHGLVLHPGTHEPWIVHPFSLSPTATWVARGARGWWAPCLWCAFGIEALVGAPCVVHARIGGEAEAIAIDGDADDLFAHFALPPRRAWDNVVHFCAMVLPFRGADDVDAWCARHRLPRGELVPVPQVRALARRWYGGHAAEDWRKHTVAEAAAIFAEVGLVGPFWALGDVGGTF